MKAIETGIQVVKDLYEAGHRMIITGEMGIGNTTPSSAMAAVLLVKTWPRLQAGGRDFPVPVWSIRSK